MPTRRMAAGGRPAARSWRPASPEPPVLIGHIDGGERDVSRVLAQDGRGLPARLGDRARLAGADAELAERLEPPGADDLPGRLGTRAEDAVHGPPVRGQDRRVREGDEDLFLAKPPVVEEFHVLRPGGLPGRHDAVQHRSDRVPDLPPAFATRPAEHARVLRRPQEWDVRVVVEYGQPRTPPEQDRESGRQAQADRDLQILRPALRRAQSICDPSRRRASSRPSRCRPGSIALGPSVDRWRPSHRRRPPDSPWASPRGGIGMISPPPGPPLLAPVVGGLSSDSNRNEPRNPSHSVPRPWGIGPESAASRNRHQGNHASPHRTGVVRLEPAVSAVGRRKPATGCPRCRSIRPSGAPGG